jgi:predicted RNA binding protein YcfA (HicA-like mRNA interferase family)
MGHEADEAARAPPRGSPPNVEFMDFVRLLEALGFQHLRIAGSHRVYAHSDVTEQLSLQPHHGEAKPYRIRQLLALVRVYNLTLRGEE